MLLSSTLATFGLDFHYISSRRKPLLNLLCLSQCGIGLGLLLAGLSTGFAPVLGRLYHSPELGKLLLFSLPVMGIEVLRLLQRAWAQKQLRFRELAIAETVNVLFYSVLAVVGLFFIRKVWLYVALFYLGNLAEALCLLWLNPSFPGSVLRRIPRFRSLNPSLGILKQNAGFLANVNAVNVLQVYAGNAPILFLGMLAAPEQMGLYFFASQLIGVPVGMLTGALSQVFFPVFAVQDRAVTLSHIRRYTSLVIQAGIPLLIGFGFALQYLIPLILGNKWNSALPLISYLLLFYGSSLLHHPISGIPVLCRKPHWELIWNCISLLTRIGALALGFRYGYNTAVLLFCIVSAVLHLAFYLMSLALLREPVIKASLTLLPRLLIPLGLGLLLSFLQGLDRGLIAGSALLGLYFAVISLIHPHLWQDFKKFLLPA